MREPYGDEYDDNYEGLTDSERQIEEDVSIELGKLNLDHDDFSKDYPSSVLVDTDQIE